MSMKVFNQRGQSMVEYIIIVALIAVSAIGVYSLFGKTVRSQVSGLSSEVSGTNSKEQIQSAKDAADSASSNAEKDYKLGNYNEGAEQGESSGGDSGGGSGTVD